MGPKDGPLAGSRAGQPQAPRSASALLNAVEQGAVEFASAKRAVWNRYVPKRRQKASQNGAERVENGLSLLRSSLARISI
jgi:hypothetical protein